MALMASITSDIDHDEVNLATLPRSQLIKMIEDLNKWVCMYKNKKHKLSQHLENVYQTIDDLTNCKDLLELQLEKATDQISTLDTQNSQLIEKLQNFESHPIFSLNSEEL